MAETLVLVHGAWHGAWCWAGVIGQLEAAGDRAYAVDLPAHGANRLDPVLATRALYVDAVGASSRSAIYATSCSQAIASAE